MMMNHLITDIAVVPMMKQAIATSTQ